MKTNIINNIKAIILSIFIVAGVGYVYSAASNWTPPGCTPPGCNKEEPINVGSDPQTKAGTLIINNTLKTNDLFVKTGTLPAVGQILTAADTDGKVKWSPASTGGSAGGIKTIIGPIEGAGTVNDKSGTFNLTTQSEVLIYAYANVETGKGRASVNLYTDGNLVKKLFYSEECKANCAGGAGSVTLISRQILPAGNHNLNVKLSKLTESEEIRFTENEINGGLQFIVYVLN